MVVLNIRLDKAKRKLMKLKLEVKKVYRMKYRETNIWKNT